MLENKPTNTETTMSEILDRKQAGREHKKRMKEAQAIRRKTALANLVRKLCQHIPELQTEDNELSESDMYQTGEHGQFDPLKAGENGLPDLFIPVPSVPDNEASFWAGIPAVLSPDRATLDSSIAPQSVLRGEVARQAKYRKKLQQKVRCGEITIEEMETRLQTFGRPETETGVIEEEGEEGHSFTLLNSDRGLRKRQQVENIARVLQMTANTSRRLVVDFGSGSGNLCLALAAKLPATTFLLVDRNLHSLQLVEARAKGGGLDNVVVKQFAFAWDNLSVFCREVEQELGMLWDLGIGLHCCGAFTDMVLQVCLQAGADCLVAPCCNGKMHQHFLALQGEGHTEQGTGYPRSRLFTRLISKEQYWSLSRAADDEDHYPAKCLVEYDRAHHQREAGLVVSLLRMNPLTATPKHHILYCARQQTGPPGEPLCYTPRTAT